MYALCHGMKANMTCINTTIFIELFQWVPPPQETVKEKEAEEQIAIDLGEEYEQALSAATQEEIIDLAGKMHSIESFVF